MHFKYYQDNRKEWRFRITAPNGEVLASGEGYKNKQDMIKTIQYIKDAAPHMELKEIPNPNSARAVPDAPYPFKMDIIDAPEETTEEATEYVMPLNEAPDRVIEKISGDLLGKDEK